MATCCHFLAVGQLYGFSGSFSQSEASVSDASGFSLWAVPPFSILSTAKSLSAPDPETVLSPSGNEEPPEAPPLALSGSSFVVLVRVSSILDHWEYMLRVIDRVFQTKKKTRGTLHSEVTRRSIYLYVKRVPSRIVDLGV